MVEKIIKELEAIDKYLSNPVIIINENYSREQINIYLNGHDDACRIAREQIDNLINWICMKAKETKNADNCNNS